MQKDCDHLNSNSGRHTIDFGHHNFVKDGNNIISLATKELRNKYRGYEQIKEKKIMTTKQQQYRIPLK